VELHTEQAIDPRINRPSVTRSETANHLPRASLGSLERLHIFPFRRIPTAVDVTAGHVELHTEQAIDPRINRPSEGIA
jgi:hypothetical protein